MGAVWYMPTARDHNVRKRPHAKHLLDRFMTHLLRVETPLYSKKEDEGTARGVVGTGWFEQFERVCVPNSISTVVVRVY
jgi:hypothetical protein